MTRTRILLADNHKGMREQVERLLWRDAEILGVFEDGQSLVTAAVKLNPDLCVLDISMPILNGLEAAHRLIGLGLTSKIIFLTVHEDSDFLQAALRAGASGYVLKRCLATDLSEAVKQVLAGEVFISGALRSPGTKTTQRLSTLVGQEV